MGDAAEHKRQSLAESVGTAREEVSSLAFVSKVDPDAEGSLVPPSSAEVKEQLPGFVREETDNVGWKFQSVDNCDTAASTPDGLRDLLPQLATDPLENPSDCRKPLINLLDRQNDLSNGLGEWDETTDDDRDAEEASSRQGPDLGPPGLMHPCPEPPPAFEENIFFPNECPLPSSSAFTSDRPWWLPDNEWSDGWMEKEREEADEESADEESGKPSILVLELEAEAAWSLSLRNPSEASSPTGSLVSRKTSDAWFRNCDQTVIIFDWDDTLCPSSVCLDKHGLSSAEPVADEDLASKLHELSLDVAALLERACEFAAEVAIVTNAGAGWVEAVCKSWMPELSPLLRNVEIVSARADWEPVGITSPTEWKMMAFRTIIDRFYSRYHGQSWKNIVAVGDAPYEHEALRRVVEEAPESCGEHCRSKSVRFMTKPSLVQLRFQVRTLRETLDTIALYDGELDIEIPFDQLPTE